MRSGKPARSAREPLACLANDTYPPRSGGWGGERGERSERMAWRPVRFRTFLPRPRRRRLGRALADALRLARIVGAGDLPIWTLDLHASAAAAHAGASCRVRRCVRSRT